MRAGNQKQTETAHHLNLIWGRAVAVCKEYEKGRGCIWDICADLGTPYTTFRFWCNKHPEVKAMYLKAKRNAYENDRKVKEKVRREWW